MPEVETQRYGGRKRTRLACDICSASRVRCDGKLPCRRCQEYERDCQYVREVKKRGRKSHPDDETTRNGKRRHDDARLPQQSAPGVARGFEHALHEVCHEEPDIASFNGPPRSCSIESEVRNVSTITARTVDSSIYRGNSPASTIASTMASLENPLLQRDRPGHQEAWMDLGVPSFDQTGIPYRCLIPLLPHLEGVVTELVASSLLDFYFAQAGSSLFRCASPYVLSHVIRSKSLLDPCRPRKTTPALLATMLWIGAQTADLPCLLLPGYRSRVCEALRALVMWLLDQKLGHDLASAQDSWSGQHGINEGPNLKVMMQQTSGEVLVDDILTYALITIVVSGGDVKSDCAIWWNRCLRLARAADLHRCDSHINDQVSPHSSRTDHVEELTDHPGPNLEAKEEKRRTFWLLYCLDRHLSLSYNQTMKVWDHECEVYIPLPEDVWISLESASPETLFDRKYGPPTRVSGIGFYEYFLPLMTILGDIILAHHQRSHPRARGLQYGVVTAEIEILLCDCADSIQELKKIYHTDDLDGPVPASMVSSPAFGTNNAPPTRYSRRKQRAQAQLVVVYTTFILQVLYVLLYGKWDAIDMLDNEDDWISSEDFSRCAASAIAASDAVSQILRCDPALTFMPYLFGIYLLHGSFILLLFADRMPQLGPNESVERACETIIRAHEASVVTLNTEFQKQFRKVLRSTLYSVQSAGTTNEEERQARRRALLSYRWTRGAHGLGI